MSGAEDAGPIVATIFVRRVGRLARGSILTRWYRVKSRLHTALGLIAALLVVTMAGAQPMDKNLALIAAARAGDEATVARLLAEGADAKAAGPDGATALIAAAWGNHLAVARRLIAAGADVNVQDRTQQSAYLIATSEGHAELLDLTLAAGADVARKDSYNGTGLIRAAHHGHVEVISRLLATPIEIDHVNRLGWTALLEAIILGDGGARHTETVRLLLEAGADPALADGQGVTPLQHAERRGYEAIASLLGAALTRRGR